MPIEIVTVPFDQSNQTFHTDDLNRFLMNKQIKEKRINFFQQGDRSYWSLFMEYEVMLADVKKDVTKDLDEQELQCFNRLREWRRVQAEEDGVPPYVIAHNNCFVEIIKKRVLSVELLKTIHGFGQKKIQKYGGSILDIMKTFFGEPHAQ